MQTLDDAMAGLKTTVSSYVNAVKLALTPMSQLTREWGLQAAAIQQVYQAQRDLARLDALGGVADARGKVAAGLADVTRYIDNLDVLAKNPMLDGSAARKALQIQSRQLGLTEEQARALQSTLDQLSAAQGPRQTAEAFAAVRRTIMAAADAGAGP